MNKKITLEELIDKNADRLDWEELSREVNFLTLGKSFIKKFSYIWDWKYVSFHYKFSFYIKREFSIYLDWDIINGSVPYFEFEWNDWEIRGGVYF